MPGTTYERRIRRTCQRRGMDLTKNSSRNPASPLYGMYQISRDGQALTPWSTLEEVEAYQLIAALRTLGAYKSTIRLVRDKKGGYTLESPARNPLMHKRNIKDMLEALKTAIRKTHDKMFEMQLTEDCDERKFKGA